MAPEILLLANGNGKMDEVVCEFESHRFVNSAARAITGHEGTLVV